MKRTTARWTTTTLAAAALMTLPGASFAQQTPPDQPPAQTQPQTPPPAQPATPPAAEQQSPQAGSSAQEAAKVHLTAARNTLSQLTQLPAAAQLQGDARTQVSQLITNFNELITTQSDWKTSFAKVQANLSALLAPAAAPAPTGTAGAVGTSGATEIDPAVRAKLMEFRNHLERFEDVAMATGETAKTEPASPAAATTAAPSTATPPAAAAPTAPPDSEPASAAEPQELLSHIDAIEAILAAQMASPAAPSSTAATPGAPRTTTSTSVTLTTEQIDMLRAHLAELRKLIEK